MNYEIKSAKEAQPLEIFFDKNTNKLSYKNKNGIIIPINTNTDTSTGETFADFLVVSANGGFGILAKSATQINGKDSWAGEDGGSELVVAWNTDDSRWELIINDVVGLYKVSNPSSTTPPSGLWQINGEAGEVYYSIIPVQGTLQDALETLAVYTAGAFDGGNVYYNNSDSGLPATNVSGAIDELAATGGYTETIVNIPSGVAGVSGIKGMGTAPIELLPAPGVGKYYDWKLIFESTGSDYTLAANLLIDCQPYGNGLIEITPFLLTDGVNQTFEVNSATQSQPLNQSINLTTVGSVNPTGGTGTLRVKIYHKTVTFGA